jgi:small-conductance mechanosensitive channel
MTLAATTTALAWIGFSSMWLYQLVREHGWDGAVRFIWEGDPNPEHVREHIATLCATEKALNEHEKIVSLLEEGLEKARQNTFDESRSQDSILAIWRQNLPHSLLDLRKQLAKVSSDLDNLAAAIDQVPTENEVGREKKLQSNRVVGLMDRVDALIAFVNNGAVDRVIGVSS